MDLKNLATLKEKLVAAKDFAPVMEYFMSEFGDHVEFIDKGHAVQNKLLEAVLCETAKQVFPGAAAIVIDRVTFVELPGHNFIHGGLLLNGRFGTMFYFPDVQMGMLAVAMSMRGPTQFVRFSGKLLAPNLAASEN